MFETKESLEKGMREATKNLEESRGLAKLHIEIVFKWEVLRSATQACLEQEIPFSNCQRSKFRCTYEQKVLHVRHRKLGEPGPHQVSWLSFASHRNEAIDTCWNSSYYCRLLVSHALIAG